MRKLNYNYKLGDKVVIPKGISWQVNEVVGEYTITDISPNLILIENATQSIHIGVDHLAYLMGESVPIEIGKLYHGTQYQPEWDDDGHLCIENSGEVDVDPPFWYCGWRGDGSRIIDDDLVRGRWCCIMLPWE